MWPFKTERHEPCRKRLADLDDKVRTLQGQLEALSVELESRGETTMHQFKQLYGRLAKREAREAPDDGAAPPAAARPEEGPAVRVVPTSAHLSRRFRTGG
jgi:TolA-binding protein